MTQTRATACAIALLLSATAATPATVPYPVPQNDFDDRLPVPAHSIGEACGSLNYRAEVAECIRSEEMQHRYVLRTWGLLSIKEQKEADTLVSAKGAYYSKFYSYLANYIEDKMRRRQNID